MLKTNLVNQIYDVIVEKIISSELKMGEKIIISSIAKEYNISPTPVREALNKLTKEELVKNIPNVGNFVFKLNKNDIEEILYIRELLEKSSLKFALKKEDKRVFIKLLADFKELKNKKDKSEIRKGFHHLDTKLHLLIITSTANRRLFEMYKRIFNILFVFILKIHHSDEYYGQNFDHCIKLLEAIIRKDCMQAENFLEIHFNHTRNNLKNYFHSGYTS